MNEMALHMLSIALLFGPICVSSAPSAASGVRFLQHFGYMKVPNPELGNIITKAEMTKAIMVFQRFAGLSQSGIFDRDTLQKMEEPRCGNPDIVGTENSARKKRYALQGSTWDKKNLKYKLVSTTGDLERHQTQKAIADAFKVWEKESGLTFTRVHERDPADIEIGFASGAHGDGDPFDGQGKTLAHAFFPQFGGDAHFDEEERWAMESRNGVNLFIVAAHEFGHSLGLSHSDVKGALMAPFYDPVFNGLHRDDIRGIQKLYGKPPNRVKPVIPTAKPVTRKTTKRPGITSRTTTTSSPPVGACNGRFDAITKVQNGSTFAFKNDIFWRLNDNGMDKDYPQKIESIWGFSGKIDASLTYQGYTDFFQGKYVRRFVNGVPLRGYPKLISNVYPGIPAGIDTAYVWSGNGRIYFMKGDQYWRFSTSLRKAEFSYPRPISVWKGLPPSIDASLQWNDRTYFFKNGYYWRLNDERVEVAQSLKTPYPRRADEWWLGCSDNSLLSLSEEDGGLRNKNEDGDNGSGSGSGSRLKTGTSLQFLTSSLILLFLTKLF